MKLFNLKLPKANHSDMSAYSPKVKSLRTYNQIIKGQQFQAIKLLKFFSFLKFSFEGNFFDWWPALYLINNEI